MKLQTTLLADLKLKPRHGLSARAILRHLAAAQGGQFSTRQAAALGVGHPQILALRDAGEVRNVRYSVWHFQSAPLPLDPAVTAFLACWPHGVISHDSAAQYHGLRRVARPASPHITVTHGQTCRPRGVTVHHTTAMAAADIVKAGPLRYTSLARLGCDLADPHDPWGTLALLDDMVALGAALAWVHDRATNLAQGRGGAHLMARASRPNGAPEFRSWLERAAAHVFAAGGLPPADWNVRITGEDGFIGIVDALWRPYLVVCELQGLRFHTTPQQLQRDYRKRNQLGDASYQVRIATWEDVVHRPVEVVVTLMRALRAGGADVDLAGIPSRIELPDRPFT